MRFFDEAPQGPEPEGRTGHKGFFYHFLDMKTGHRSGPGVELSTIDTTLLLAGVLFCQSYFDGPRADERAIRDLAERIYSRVDWSWAAPRPPIVSMGWRPEVGHYEAEWRIYDESMILYVLALGSPTHPLPDDAWRDYTAKRRLDEYRGQTHVNFAPLFGHQYSHVWIDFRGIADDSMAAKGLDYFENSRRATLAQRAYAIANPGGWTGYGPDVWGLTACDGPDAKAVVNGRRCEFWGYALAAPLSGRSATTAPWPPPLPSARCRSPRRSWCRRCSRCAAVTARTSIRRRLPRRLQPLGARRHAGQAGPRGPRRGMVRHRLPGNRPGPILAMIENHRNGFVWRVMQRNPHVRRGLLRAGFRGGWLEAVRRRPAA